MDQELINLIFKVVLLPLIGVFVTYLVDYLKAKRDELKALTSNETAHKYIDMVTDTITRCVIATNQTYVNSLKEQGEFDAIAQQNAFQKTLSAVLDILSVDAKSYIMETTGDISIYLTQLIEAEVAKQKAA